MLPNAEELFNGLLAAFPGLLPRLSEFRVDAAPNPDAVAAAVAGFARFGRAQDWEPEHTQFIIDYISAELSGEVLSWHGAGADRVILFSCFAIGAMLALYARGDLDDAGFTMYQAILPGFILMHDGAISVEGR